jgi:hypothetical protein
MKRLLTYFGLTVISMIAVSGRAQAQIREHLELNLFGGGSVYTTKNYQIGFPQAIDPVSGRFRFDTAWRGGVRFNVFSRGHWGQEFMYSYEPNAAHFLRRSTPASRLDLDMKIHNAAVNALYYFNEDQTRPVRPFLTIGVGAAIYQPTDEARAIARDPFRGNVEDLDASAELAMNSGFGFKARAGDWIGFRFDLRGFLGRNPSFGLARSSTDPTATVFPGGGAIHNGEASAGVIFYFQRR